MRFKIFLSLLLCIVFVGVLYADCDNVSGNSYGKAAGISIFVKLVQNGCNLSGTIMVLKFGEPWHTYTLTGSMNGNLCNFTYSGGGSFSGTHTPHHLIGNMVIPVYGFSGTVDLYNYFK